MVKVISRNIIILYIALWMLYYLQEMLMIKGVIAQLIFIILMAMSFYACYKVNWYHHICPYVKWLNVMLVVMTIYGVIPIVNGSSFHLGIYANSTVRNYAYLQHMYISVMPIYVFYYYSMKRRLASENLAYVYLMLFSLSIILFYQLLFKETINNGKDNIVNNIGYLFVPLIPMLSLLKLGNVWKYIFALLSFCFIMLSMKRGAILAGSVLLLLFMKHNFRLRTKQQLVFAFFLLLTSIFVIYRFVMNLYATNVFFQQRLTKTIGGYSSHRDELYDFFWHYFTERTSTWEFFFGHGAQGTVSLYGQYAHNDWLEFAINQGVLGIVLYFIYWCVFAWEWKDYHGPKTSRTTLGDIIITYFLIAFFSVSIGDMPLAATLCIGYCLAEKNSNKNRFKRVIYVPNNR